MCYEGAAFFLMVSDKAYVEVAGVFGWPKIGSMDLRVC